MHRAPIRTAILGMVFSPFSLAQMPAQEPESSQLERPAAMPAWRIPIHSGPDDATGAAYGLWAVGPDYKASFHDGFVFHPVLGSRAAKSLPLAWRTESVTVGGQDTVDLSAARHARADWRYEYHFADFVEAYDVRRDGVEQTFTLTARPGARGDLVVVGRLETDLRAADSAARHGDLVFCDAQGQPVISYGAAVAFDAAGQRTDVMTAHEDGRVRLRLAGGWLDRAVFPVTIDPLVRSVVLTAAGQPGTMDAATKRRSCCSIDDILVVETRAVSATDYDCRGLLFSQGMSLLGTAFADAASWSTQYAQAAVAEGARGPGEGRFVVAVQRDFSTGQALIRAYVHDIGSRVLNSGKWFAHSGTSGAVQRFPSVGANHDEGVLIAYQEDVGIPAQSTDTSSIWVVPFDPSEPSPTSLQLAGFGTAAAVTSTIGGSEDNEWPCVSRSRIIPTISPPSAVLGAWDTFVVVWQSYDNTMRGDAWDIRAALVRTNGTVLGTTTLGPRIATTDHKVRPKVDGGPAPSGPHRYLVAYTTAANIGTKTPSGAGTEIHVQRIDWDQNNAANPAVRAPKTLATFSPFQPGTTGDGNRGVAYDWSTASHWAVAYQSNPNFATFTGGSVFVSRVGYTGETLEDITVYAGSATSRGYAPSVCAGREDQGFPMVWATDEVVPRGNYRAFAAKVQHDPAADSQTYGTSCIPDTYVRARNGIKGAIPPSSPAPIVEQDPLYAGSQFCHIDLGTKFLTRPAWLVLGVSPATVPLSRTCFLHVGPPLWVVAGVSGSGTRKFALRDAPQAVDLYWQWAQYDASTSTMLWSQGLKTSIR